METFSIFRARSAPNAEVKQVEYAGEELAKKEAYRLAVYLYHSAPGTFYEHLKEALNEVDKGDSFSLTLSQHLKRVEEEFSGTVPSTCEKCGRR